MALIFYLSHQPAEESSELSSGLLDLVLIPFKKFIPSFLIDYSYLHFLIRKMAHFFAYFMLGIFALNALYITRMKMLSSILMAFLLCVIYAISDEVHQLYIPGRSGEIRDVFIDSVGASCGIALYYSVFLWRKRIKRLKINLVRS